MRKSLIFILLFFYCNINSFNSLNKFFKVSFNFLKKLIMPRHKFDKLSPEEKILYRSQFKKVVKFGIAFKFVKIGILTLIYKEKIKKFVYNKVKPKDKPKDFLHSSFLKDGPKFTGLCK
jgi:hypothetical protein